MDAPDVPGDGLSVVASVPVSCSKCERRGVRYNVWHAFLGEVKSDEPGLLYLRLRCAKCGRVVTRLVAARDYETERG